MECCSAKKKGWTIDIWTTWVGLQGIVLGEKTKLKMLQSINYIHETFLTSPSETEDILVTATELGIRWVGGGCGYKGVQEGALRGHILYQDCSGSHPKPRTWEGCTHLSSPTHWSYLKQLYREQPCEFLDCYCTTVKQEWGNWIKNMPNLPVIFFWLLPMNL